MPHTFIRTIPFDSAMVIANYELETPLHAPRTSTLVSLFSSVARAYPDRIAVAVGDDEVTYAQLDAITDVVADRLRSVGAGSGEYVGIKIASGTLELYAGILAILKSGAAYVPVDADDPDERAVVIFETADVLAVLTDGFEIDVRRKKRITGSDLTGASDAWVIFTSGTTGAPKGVAVSHKAAVAFIRAEQCLWEVQPTDRVLAGLSISFDASCEEIWTAWSNGATLVPIPRSVVRSGLEMGPWMREHSVTVVSSVPTLAAMWGDDVLEGVRLLILGGEALPEPLGHHLAQYCEVWNTYGPTEATVVSTAAPVRIGMPITIGFALNGWETALIDENGHLVNLGEPGELVIGGIGLGRYLDPELDNERYAPLPQLGWDRAYRSGDVVRETPNGYAFVGRRDDQVKIGGRRIELGEVDARLADCDSVIAAAATVQESASGNKVLVGYVVARTGVTLDTVAIRDQVASLLSGGIAPLVVQVDSLPQKSSGKIDRKALPWPPPISASDTEADDLGATGAWVAQCWRDQLGPIPLEPQSDFFHLGGTSLSAARLVNALRERFPAVAISDVYLHPQISDLAERLDGMGEHGVEVRAPKPLDNSRRHLSALVHVIGLAIVMAVGAVPWLVGILVYDDIVHEPGLPTLSWWALIPIWLVVGSLPGRMMLVAGLRRLLLNNVRPGRYRRHSWLSWRLWFLDSLAQVFHIDHLAGTPWAGRAARLAGFDIDPTAHVETMPPPSAVLSIGARVTVEKEVDFRGWNMEGSELVVAPIVIEADARIAQRAMLNPGVRIGRGAEVEAGTVVCNDIGPGERWSGSPAVRVGDAGELWPERERIVMHGRANAVYGAALAFRELVPLISSAPALLWIALNMGASVGSDLANLLLAAPILGLVYFVVHAVVLALAIRLVGSRFDEGWHRNDSVSAAALWLCESLMADAMVSLFPLFSSSFTRRWLRWCGIRVGRGTEVSTATGLSHLISYGELCFSTDAVGFVTARSRGGWTEIRRIEIGDRSFLGNTCTVLGGTKIGDDCLIGLQTRSPLEVPNGTTWFGTPAIEFPRARVQADTTRTLFPSRRLRALRRGFDLLRIGVPAVASGYLAAGSYGLIVVAAQVWGTAMMLVAAPVIALALGLAACALTIAMKWVLIGRYRVSTHPFFSTFVWRDELINSCQEMLAGKWLLSSALGTPVMNVYLRLMGAKVGADAYVATLAITEFDQVEIGESAAVNKASCIQTHLFSDRVMQIGPSRLGAGSTIGPQSAVLLETSVGDDTHIGLGSVLMRGEELPDGTKWVGVPLVPAVA